MPVKWLDIVVRLSVVALLAALAPACQSAAKTASTAPVILKPDKPPQEGEPAYTLGVGDVFDVKLFYHPELNETLTVRLDGKVSLQLVGEAQAAGVTPEALSQRLREAYVAAGLRDPLVAVILRKSAGQRVFVGGEVGAPKMVPYEGRLSLSQALFEAGGLKSTAGRGNIVLLRDDGKGAATILTVDFDEVLRNRADIALQPYDVIIVPKSTIARVNDFVEQYFTKLIPIALSAGFSYVTGATAVTGTR